MEPLIYKNGSNFGGFFADGLPIPVTFLRPDDRIGSERGSPRIQKSGTWDGGTCGTVSVQKEKAPVNEYQRGKDISSEASPSYNPMYVGNMLAY